MILRVIKLKLYNKQDQRNNLNTADPGIVHNETERVKYISTRLEYSSSLSSYIYYVKFWNRTYVKD